MAEITLPTQLFDFLGCGKSSLSSKLSHRRRESMGGAREVFIVGSSKRLTGFFQEFGVLLQEHLSYFVEKLLIALNFSQGLGEIDESGVSG